MGEEHLGQTGIKGSFWGMESTRLPVSGQCGKGHTQVIDRLQRQEIVHWLVQAMLLLYDEEGWDVA